MEDYIIIFRVILFSYIYLFLIIFLYLPFFYHSLFVGDIYCFILLWMNYFIFGVIFSSNFYFLFFYILVFPFFRNILPFRNSMFGAACYFLL